MAFINAKDGTRLYVKDWGKGRPVLFVHGWCLASDSWEYMMTELVEHGFRCIAYDQRGCGRSDQAWDGYELEALADDLATVVDQLQLSNAVLVGHSMGCAVICAYLASHQPSAICKASLIGTTTPYVQKDASNPGGMEPDLYDTAIAALKKDKPAFVRGLAEAFFNLKSEHTNISPAMIDWAVSITESATLKAAIALQYISFFADLREALPTISIPVLLQHGQEDVSSPLALSAQKSLALLPQGELKVYPHQAHGVQISAWAAVSTDLIRYINQ